ncbi:MAG: Jag N-terminal domain-containing protein [Clostridia bacterium]|nr:Jag N-terminal domain-containing protein [Clostridia bacterium]
MRKEIIIAGKDAEEAVNNAIAAFGVSSLEDIGYEIVDLGSKGIFGIGARPTKVKAWIETPDEEPKAQGSNTAEDKKPSHERAGGERSRNRNRRGRNRRSDGMQPPRDFVAPKESAKPREAVIPEAELKMELVTVSEGEDLSFDFVKLLVQNLGINAEVSLYHCEDNSRRIVIAGEDAAMLIGHHGEALDSLQYLANLASTKKNANGERNRRRVTIDIEGYRAKREETLRALARKMAAKALRTRRNVMLEPMSAYERRIIHSEVQGIAGVSTNSIGADNNRKIVIYLTEEEQETPNTVLTEAEQAPVTVAEDVVEDKDTTETETV